MSESGGQAYRDLIAFAGAHPDCLALALSGSRAAGLERPTSDYDCTLFVRDDTVERVVAALGPTPDGLDLRVFDRTGFRHHATWGSDTMWDRYAWSIAHFPVDRTGGALPEEARAKGRVPEERRAAWIDGSLDWYLNQVARALRCLAVDDVTAARLEAGESARPLLQALFAADSSRHVPYYGYLRWELAHRPLERLGIVAADLLSWLGAMAAGAPGAEVELLRRVEGPLRAAGYGGRFDEWATDTWHPSSALA